MPPGLTRPKPTSRVLERTTAETCLAISKRVEAACQREGDWAGMAAAQRITELIQREVLEAGFGRSPAPGST
jgi:hypothetical protein